MIAKDELAKFFVGTLIINKPVKKANNVDIKRVRPITFMRLSKELYLPSDRIKPQIENKIN